MDKIIVDYNITPENAKNSGLVWWRDHIYDPEAPKIVNRDLEEMIKQGIILGSPATSDGKENKMVGIYRKI